MKIFAATLVAAAGAARIETREITQHRQETKSEHDVAQQEIDYAWDGDGSPFEEWAATLDTPDCPSRVRRSTCSNDQFRGIVVFYHGYSACSEQVESVSEMLANSCMDVLAPTMPGHGTKFVWCREGGSTDCDVTVGNGNGWTHDGLPTHRSAYDDFAYYANRATQREFRHRSSVTGKSRDDLEINLIGLSFGAPMALEVAMRGSYARMMLVNPYLALGDEVIDQAVNDCEALIESGQRTEHDCEVEAINGVLGQVNLEHDSTFARLFFGDETEEVSRKLFTTFARLSDAVGSSYQGRQEGEPEGSIAPVMESEHEWGAVCNQIWNENRGGFCKFRTKHYLATHSFSLHAVVDAQEYGAWGWFGGNLPITQIMTTQRDGKTRNGLTYDLAQHLYSVSPGSRSDHVSMCMHKFQEGTNRADAGQYWSDENSMPHANLKGTRQGGRWWEPKLFENVRKFILGEETSINEHGDLADMTFEHHDRNVCEAVPLQRGAQRTDEVSELVHVGIAPTWSSELRPGLIFGVLGLTHR